MPVDRDVWWLDPRQLYRVHTQVVELLFAEDPPE
jgi:hypothetical protein